jgi:hypothetical protein
MNSFEVTLYFICFALIAGGAFAMMWANIQSINIEMRTPPKPKHPEAPKAGEELMYVDLSREKLEDIYKQGD